MARAVRILEQVDRLPLDNVEPIYVLDTSAIIDLEEHDPIGLRAFLGRSSTLCTLAAEVLDEMQHHHHTYVGKKRLIERDVIERIQDHAQATAALLQAITCHELYDGLRYCGITLAHELCREKKRSRDPISYADSHTLAITLALAAHANEFGLPNHYPVLLTSDEHLSTPLQYLSNPFFTDHIPQYLSIRVIRPRP